MEPGVDQPFRLDSDRYDVFHDSYRSQAQVGIELPASIIPQISIVRNSGSRAMVIHAFHGKTKLPHRGIRAEQYGRYDTRRNASN
jgi:hypothetical protein